MSTLLVPTGTRPWFRGHPGAAVAVSATLFAGVLGLRYAVDDPDEPVTLLFCLPIALLAVTFGRRIGTVAGLAGITLLSFWAWTTGADLSLLGWVTRAVPMLLLGVLLGDAVDRLLAYEQERVSVERISRRHRQAVEINDSIVQHLTAAKWAVEAGDTDRALEILTSTVGSAQLIVSELLRDADAGAPRGRRARVSTVCPQQTQGVRPVQRAMATGQFACRMRAWPTDPSTRPARPLWPRDPMTTSKAVRLASARSCAADPTSAWGSAVTSGYFADQRRTASAVSWSALR